MNINKCLIRISDMMPSFDVTLWIKTYKKTPAIRSFLHCRQLTIYFRFKESCFFNLTHYGKVRHMKSDWPLASYAHCK